MTQQSAEPLLTGVRNFRDLAGLPAGDGRRIRPGRFFRSGHLAKATEEDRRVLDSLGLHTIFDFRNAADQALEGADVELSGVRNVNLPLTDPADGADFWRMVRHGQLAQLRAELEDGRAAGRMVASYRMMIRERRDEHGRVLRSLAGGSTPVLMHCAAGKDRAGLTVAITLIALGIEREAIIADYLKSNIGINRYRVTRGSNAEGGLSEEVMELLAPLFDARHEYLQAAFDQIVVDWGDTETYLREGLGVGPEHRERLRDSFLH
ncbi:tyrosine-protein phosphatase [Streptomyces alkaliphilus]|uniref:Protein-tyrosine-phosphatase n=1 Tax=Streptomyces alkaliphilus TaxID=1472722 RepID=A0A7W3Y2S2_9ACTN|nr:tyrosine-protein phosphatase [Streptomyces alkaliphilus]MBB0246084.1 protein-tyrosine-phosphatase [Streptomyces alkaliphilus]MQS09307.1 protein-tyrosine-phosphatase [Streptomyces alkaliphilus]